MDNVTFVIKNRDSSQYLLKVKGCKWTIGHKTCFSPNWNWGLEKIATKQNFFIRVVVDSTGSFYVFWLDIALNFCWFFVYFSAQATLVCVLTQLLQARRGGVGWEKQGVDTPPPYFFLRQKIFLNLHIKKPNYQEACKNWLKMKLEFR